MDFLNKVSSRYLTLKVVALVSFTVIVLAFLLAVVVFFVTLFSSKLFAMDLCLASECVDFWVKKNSAVFTILASAGTVVTGMVTIGGILIAVKSYQSSVRASSITNHLSHLSLFMAYVASEIKRRSRLADSEVESLKWYNLVYDKSISGVLSVSNEYSGFMKRLNSQIDKSNNLYVGAEDPGYRYKDHQAQMILILSEIGVYLERLPRIDFNEVEVQVLDLIRTINMSFCKDAIIPEIPDRKYH
ncbi:retron Ec48 family effector membrane protein [Pseudomonas putida]|nr:retron Ec48 family effector membrane protein [Pseudomonas putida]